MVYILLAIVGVGRACSCVLTPAAVAESTAVTWQLACACAARRAGALLSRGCACYSVQAFAIAIDKPCKIVKIALVGK